MRKVFHGTLAAAVATWSIGATAAAEPGAREDRVVPQRAAKPATETPQVEVNVKIAEFDEHDRAEIDRALGISKSYGIAADDKVVHSLEERKLLQVTTSPTIRTPNGSKASVSYEAGQGLDRRDDAKPITHEIEIAPTIVSGNEPKIVTEIRYRETTGKGDSQRTREIQTGAKLKPGDTLAFHFSPQPSAHGKNAQAASGVGKLLFVKATIVKPKPAAGEAKPNPRVSYRKSPAQQ